MLLNLGPLCRPMKKYPMYGLLVLILRGSLWPARPVIAQGMVQDRSDADQNLAALFLPLVTAPSTTTVSPPVILTFTANPATIAPGGTSTLSWEVIGATQLSISPGIGPVSGTSVAVQPATRTEYTLTASNAAGTATVRTTVDLISGGGGGGGDEGAIWLPYHLANGDLLPTYGASIGVDGRGGVHVAFGLLGHYDQAEDGDSSYAYCAANCAQKENWQFLHLGDSSEVRLALDPAGKPRLLLATPGEISGDYQQVSYRYGVCDTGCTQAANWRFTTVAEVTDSVAWVGGRETENNRYFALDPEGHPAFLYTRFDPEDPYMGYLDYATCAAPDPTSCVEPAQWSITTLAHTNFPESPSLDFAGPGQPRAAIQVSNGLESALCYTACDQNCTDDESWSWRQFTATSYYETMTFSLRLDGQGRPRLALYSGAYNTDPSPFADDLLYYLWCDEGCAEGDAPSWHSVAIGLPTLSGHDVALALDSQGRPRIVYNDRDQGLAYSWCNENCASTGATWRHAVAETSASLSDDYEVLPIRRCTVSTWFTGVRPGLALDDQGNLRIAYDAQHYWYGTETVGGQVKPCNFKDINVTRFAAVNRPE
jgi:hypothetical protein